MFRSMIAACVVLPALLVACAERSNRLQDFEEREGAWVVALRDTDDVSTLRPMFEEMIADDFVYQHGSGRNLTKEAYIELLVTQGITVETLGPLELQIRDYGDVVISYGVSPMSGRVFYEFPYDGRLRFVNVWRFHDGRWRLHHRNSELLEE